MISEETRYQVLEKMLSEKGILDFQINSFNHFIKYDIQRGINEENKIIIKNDDNTKVYMFGDVTVEKPKLINDNRVVREYTPMEARFRDLTYQSTVRVDIHEDVYDDENKLISSTVMNRVNLTRIPCMIGSDICVLKNMNEDGRIKSGECMMEEGGYFIIKGKERVIIPQERINYNKISAYKNNDGSFGSDMRSMSDETGHSVLTTCVLPEDSRNMYFTTPCIAHHIPIGIMFYAIGLSESDIISSLKPRRVVEMFNEYEMRQWNNFIKFIIRDSYFIKNTELTDEQAAKKWLESLIVNMTENQTDYIEQVITIEIFPHLGITASKKEYGWLLARMVINTLLTKIGRKIEDDKDKYNNKRVECVGTLLSDLFRSSFKRFIRSLKPYLQKQQNIQHCMSKLNNIEKDIKYCFSTGNWGLQKTNYVRTGVSQVLSRLSYTSTISHLRRLIIPVGKEVKNGAIRQIHQSSAFYICLVECFDPNTLVLLWNGKCVKASEINVGDELIGSNGNSTRVKSTCSGVADMYMVQQEGGNSYTVTSNHILTLKIKKHNELIKVKHLYILTWFNKRKLRYNYQMFNTKKDAESIMKNVGDDIIDITIKDYLSLPESTRNDLVGFRSGKVNWAFKYIGIDPYLFGIRMGNMNPLDFDIIRDSMVNDEDSRILMLAGIIDVNGIIDQLRIKIKIRDFLIENVVFLIRSLGISCVIDKHGYIKFDITNELVKHSVLIKKNFVNTDVIKIEKTTELMPITVVKLESSKFVGWQLEQDERFLLKDFSVVHNTPEGQPVGIVKNFALTTTVSTRVNSSMLKNVLNSITINGDTDDWEEYPILVNGRVYSFTKDWKETVKHLRELRDYNIIPKSVSISFSKDSLELNIYTDEGRMLRPLYVLPQALSFDWSSDYTFDQLLDKNIIRYLDPAEVECSVIAMNPNDIVSGVYDYMEMHPMCMLGVVGSVIPYPDHNQAPRVCYYSSMNKQTIGLCATNYNIRTDTMYHSLDYAQKPIVTTRMAKALHNSEMPSGINCMVAILPKGWNEEDCVILNKSAIDRGLFVSHTFRTVVVEEKRVDSYTNVTICYPDKQYQKPNYNYKKLDKNGVIIKGVVLDVGDVIIGKLMKKTTKTGVEITDTSVTVCMKEEGIVDEIYVTTNMEGYKVFKIRIRSIKIPELGDKVASVAAQKGTCGMIFNQEDMPFTKDGVVPDIIMNPAAFPSLKYGSE